MSILLHKIRNSAVPLLKNFPPTAWLLKQISFAMKPYIQQKFALIEREKITVTLDVGAYAGEYGNHLRHFGYKAKIHSFEPNPEPFKKLAAAASKDPLWSAHPFALGSKNEFQQFNILECNPASSFLKITDQFQKDWGTEVNTVRSHRVEIKRLDTIYDSLCQPTDTVFLKIDTQGYEHNVLLGAKDCLDRIRLIQVETSLMRLYENEIVLGEMLAFMEERGWVLIGVEPHQHHAKTLRQYQVDLLFQQEKALH